MPKTSSRSPLALVATGAMLVVVVAGGFLLLRPDGGPVAQPSPSPSPSPSPTPAPDSEPFEVELTRTRVDTMGNGRIFGRNAGNTQRGTTAAAKEALEELATYLDAQFLDSDSRFTAAPMKALLTSRAEQELGRRDRRALGADSRRDGPTRAGEAVARARVLYDGRTAHAVALTYRAAVTLRSEDSEDDTRLVQSGTMVFVPAPGGWRADVVDVRLRTRTRAPARSERPAPAPSATAPSATPPSVILPSATPPSVILPSATPPSATPSEPIVEIVS